MKIDQAYKIIKRWSAGREISVSYELTSWFLQPRYKIYIASCLTKGGIMEEGFSWEDVLERVRKALPKEDLPETEDF